MNSLIPLSAFENETLAVIARDADGRIRLWNRAAARLLRCGVKLSSRARCWESARLCTPEGAPFCSADCPIQQEARRGIRASIHWVRRRSASGVSPVLELLSFTIPESQDGQQPIIHFLRPVSSATPRSPGGCARVPARACDSPFPLSRRETEIVKLIATGMDTRRLATSLGITATTLRNHLQNIFRKTGVHRRIELALAFAGGSAIRTPAEGGAPVREGRKPSRPPRGRRSS